MKIVFSDRYYAATPTASMRKLPRVAALCREAGFEILDPTAHSDWFDSTVQALRAIHDPDYVDEFLSGTGRASTNKWPWTPEIMRGVVAINSGQILACELAVRDRLAANIAQGFHHARPDRGAGYCTFNGLALVAATDPNRSVFVLDCDQHGGDGTAEFARTMPNLFCYSVCGTSYGAASHERSIVQTAATTQDYLNYLDQALATLESQRPDLVIYQAGMDCMVEDPMATVDGSGLSAEAIRQRDERALEFLISRNFATLIVLAGGYIDDLDRLAKRHYSTIHCAAKLASAQGRLQPSPPLRAALAEPFSFD